MARLWRGHAARIPGGDHQPPQAEVAGEVEEVKVKNAELCPGLEEREGEKKKMQPCPRSFTVIPQDRYYLRQQAR